MARAGSSPPRARAIDEGLWALQLPLPYPNVSSVNAYLLRDAQATVLVDCGTSMGGGWEALTDALGQAGARPQDLDVLVCTHGHCDHYGLASELIARTGCELHMAPGPHLSADLLREITLPMDEKLARHHEAGTPAADAPLLAAGMDNGDGAYEHAVPDVLLGAGDRREMGGASWEVVPAAGHCADQVALWDGRGRRLIGADLVMPDVPPYLEYGTHPDPYGDYLDAIDRVSALEPAVILPGHGRPVTGAAALLARARADLEALAEGTLAALERGPHSAYDVAQELAPGETRLGPRQRTLCAALCILEHLQARGEVTSELDGDGVRRWAPARRINQTSG